MAEQQHQRAERTDEEPLSALPALLALGDKLVEDLDLLDLLGVDLARLDALFAPTAGDVREGVEADELREGKQKDMSAESERLEPFARGRKGSTYVGELKRTCVNGATWFQAGPSAFLRQTFSTSRLALDAPMGTPAPSFIAVSMSAAVASPRSTMRIASRR